MIAIRYRFPDHRWAAWRRLAPPVASVAWICLVVGSLPGAAQDPDGVQIYRQHCAACHGDQGQGAEAFAHPLEGDLSLPELTRYITESMPEEDPQRVTGAEAAAVSQFVFEAFYSAPARARRQAPRVELARLTVRQYRQTLADLLRRPTANSPLTDKRGLQATYFAARGRTPDRKLAEQVDPAIDFLKGVPHFDPSGKYASLEPPKQKPENRMNDGFSAYWRGGLIAPVTGTYRIRVLSRNGFQLFVNNPYEPLIDRKVRSDDVLEHEAEIVLLEGRPYHFRLDLFSYPSPPAEVEVRWQPPGQPESVIENRYLVPVDVEESFVVTTPFPPDDASQGYARGTDVSQLWDQATTAAAIEAATWTARRIPVFAGFRPDREDGQEQARAFCLSVVERAWGHPLSDEDRQRYVDQHFQADLPLVDQVKRVLLMTLKSPRFLYPDLAGRSGGQEQVSRAARLLWDSIPDERLRRVAEGKGFDSAEARRRVWQAMLDDDRARSKLASFFESWLVTHPDGLFKDTQRYPEFDEALTADLKTSLMQFVDQVAWSQESDFRQLFESSRLPGNPRLAAYYQWSQPETAFAPVDVGAHHRWGLLTHPYLMAELAYHQESSPIHRGVFVAKRLLGRQLRQPPQAVQPLTEEAAPELTTRQRVEHQTSEAACMSCHKIINALGFTLEHYDTVGRYRETDGKRPIDAVTTYRTRDGRDIELAGPQDLAVFVANDPATQQNFIGQLFRYYVKQPPAAYGPDTLERLHRRFVEQNCSIRELLLSITETVAGESISDARLDSVRMEPDSP